MKRCIAILLSCTILFLTACVEKEQPDYDKKAMFINYADNLIQPAFTAYGQKLAALKTAFTNFSTTSDATNLTALQTAFLDAYTVWQSCEIYEKTTPSDEVMAIDNNNYFPSRADSITAYIQRGSTSLSFVKNRIKSDKGLPAMEYLLYGKDNAQTLIQFTTDPNATAYKAYLESLIDNCIQVNTDILTKWNTYRDIYINSLGTDAAGSLSLMVNSIARRIDDFKRHQVGIPAGYQGNVKTIYTKPEATQTYYAKKSVEYMLLTLDNLEKVLNGKSSTDTIGGNGLINYIQTLNYTSTFGGNLADDVIAQIAVCKTKATACGTDYSNTVITDIAKADALFLEAKKLLVLMKVDVPSALGVSITYTDSDGD